MLVKGATSGMQCNSLPEKLFCATTVCIIMMCGRSSSRSTLFANVTVQFLPRNSVNRATDLWFLPEDRSRNNNVIVLYSFPRKKTQQLLHGRSPPWVVEFCAGAFFWWNVKRYNMVEFNFGRNCGANRLLQKSAPRRNGSWGEFFSCSKYFAVV